MGICLRRWAINTRFRARGDPSLSVPLLVSGVPGDKLRTVRLGIRLAITSSNGAMPVDRCGWLLYAMDGKVDLSHATGVTYLIAAAVVESVHETLAWISPSPVS